MRLVATLPSARGASRSAASLILRLDRQWTAPRFHRRSASHAKPSRCIGGRPDRLRPILQAAGLVHDEHAALVVEVFDHVRPQVIATRVGVPPRRVLQALHPAWVPLAQVLRQLLAAPARQRPARSGGDAPVQRISQPFLKQLWTAARHQTHDPLIL